MAPVALATKPPFTSALLLLFFLLVAFSHAFPQADSYFQTNDGYGQETTPTPSVSAVGASYSSTSSTNTTADCVSGETYKVKSGENCTGISIALGVSTRALIHVNTLFENCTNLIADTEICVPLKCKTYVVQEGDVCSSVAEKQGIKLSELLQFNLDINGICDNLNSGFNICLSGPNGCEGSGGVSTAAGDYGGIMSMTSVGGATATGYGGGGDVVATTTSAADSYA
ncbi:MAG: hypothetical protein Q9167_002408 [Letrouitia subvulpina]